MKNYKCYLTNKILEPGDIVIRPVHSGLYRHVFLKETENGCYLSRKLILSSSGKYIYDDVIDNINQHNSKVYVQYQNNFIFIDTYKGDINKFNKTFEQFTKENIK